MLAICIQNQLLPIADGKVTEGRTGGQVSDKRTEKEGKEVCIEKQEGIFQNNPWSKHVF